jgi:hypothetical protein
MVLISNGMLNAFHDRLNFMKACHVHYIAHRICNMVYYGAWESLMGAKTI